MPRQHRRLPDLMAELELTMRPLVANYVFLNTYFFLEATPDDNISTDFTIARFRRRASIHVLDDADGPRDVDRVCMNRRTKCLKS